MQFADVEEESIAPQLQLAATLAHVAQTMVKEEFLKETTNALI